MSTEIGGTVRAIISFGTGSRREVLDQCQSHTYREQQQNDVITLKILLNRLKSAVGSCAG